MSSRSDIGVLLSAGVVTEGDEWFIDRRDGQRVVGRLTADGTLRVLDHDYASPSTAARAVLGTAANGWRRWKFSDGDRVRYIDELRARLDRTAGVDPSEGP